MRLPRLRWLDRLSPDNRSRVVLVALLAVALLLGLAGMAIRG